VIKSNNRHLAGGKKVLVMSQFQPGPSPHSDSRVCPDLEVSRYCKQVWTGPQDMHAHSYIHWSSTFIHDITCYIR
jgi:hypothetical protein